MPILSGGLVTTPVVDADDTETPVWTEDYGTINATWVDPAGVEWPLSDTSDDSLWFTMHGPAGWGATPIEIVTDPLPRGGEQVRFIRSQPRRLQWPIYIGSPNSHEEFVGAYRSLVRAFTMTSVRRAPGWLKVARPNGRYRQIACYYEQGLEGESGENHRYAKPVITLFCPDGYWSGDRPVVAERQFTGGGTDPGDGTTIGGNFFNPFMTIGSSKVSTGSPDDPAVPIANTGDVDAWPVWTITGPMTKLTAINDTVGSRFALSYALTDQQTITITTDRPSVRGPGSANLTKYVDWFNPLGTELWPLAPGSNNIRFQVDGAGPGTKVQMAFTPRYETA